MRHTYLCPLRWADLDELGHVNNVVYVDYLQEARVDMLRRMRGGMPTGENGEGVVVVRHEIAYLAPLELQEEPLHIESWVTEVRAASFTMAYELYVPRPDGSRRVHARATTLLSPFLFSEERPRRLTAEERAELSLHLEPPTVPPPDRAGALDLDGAHHYPVQVRFSDVDLYRHVNNVKYVEYLQEARVLFARGLWRSQAEGGDEAQVVVAQTDVDYRVPMLLRAEPYEVYTRLTRVGSRSITLDSEIRDGEVLCARGRVVLVFFDRAAQRSVAPSAEVLERLTRACSR